MMLPMIKQILRLDYFWTPSKSKFLILCFFQYSVVLSDPLTCSIQNNIVFSNKVDCSNALGTCLLLDQWFPFFALKVKKNSTDPYTIKEYYCWTLENLEKRFQMVQYFTFVIFEDPLYPLHGPLVFLGPPVKNLCSRSVVLNQGAFEEVLGLPPYIGFSYYSQVFLMKFINNSLQGFIKVVV